MSEVEVSVTIRCESEKALAEIDALIEAAVWDALDRLISDHALQEASHVDVGSVYA
jgi:hypothetical protein